MDLLNVKIGDVFLIPRSYGWGHGIDYYEKAYCEKITNSQCVIGGNKYRKLDAKPIGNSISICAYSNALWEKTIKFGMRKFVENYKYNLLDDGQCQAIYMVLKGFDVPQDSTTAMTRGK